MLVQESLTKKGSPCYFNSRAQEGKSILYYKAACWSVEVGAMDLTYISLEKKDRVAIAWLNKPKANTYDAGLMRDLNTMIDDVRFDDDVDVCVIASKLDGVWSAGADINLLASSTPDYKAMFCLNCQEILNKMRSEEHTSELQSPCNLVCRLLLEKKTRSRL